MQFQDKQLNVLAASSVFNGRMNMAADDGFMGPLELLGLFMGPRGLEAGNENQGHLKEAPSAIAMLSHSSGLI